jgi:DNA-directed RNA polymerase I subunit RPA12
MESLPSKTIITSSQPKPAPEWLQLYRKAQNLEPDDSKETKRSVIQEECPICKNPQMEFYAMQLRSADEGQTVFYECKKCGHKFSVNT